MHILITGGNSRWARQIATALSPAHKLRLFDRSFTHPVDDGIESVTGDPCEPTTFEHALEGIDVLLHFAPYLAGLDPSVDTVTTLDEATRGTFVVTNAARQAGVSRIILAGTLAYFDRFPEHFQVNEEWRPRPTP